jgi:hypothetical protein
MRDELSQNSAASGLKAEADVLRARQKRLLGVAGALGVGSILFLITGVKLIKTMDDREDQRAAAMVLGVLLLVALAAAAICAGLALASKGRISAKEAEADAASVAAWSKKRK